MMQEQMPQQMQQMQEATRERMMKAKIAQTNQLGSHVPGVMDAFKDFMIWFSRSTFIMEN